MFLLFLMALYTPCAVCFLLSVVEDRPIHKRSELQVISLLLFIKLAPPNTDITWMFNLNWYSWHKSAHVVRYRYRWAVTVLRGNAFFSVICVLWNTSLKEKKTDEFIINGKSVSLAREVTRTLAFVISCCTNSVKFLKVTPRVAGYGCWLDVTLIASQCCSDGDVPASRLEISEDYYAFALNLTSIQKFPQNSHKTHGNSAQFPYQSHIHTRGNSNTHGSPVKNCLT